MKTEIYALNGENIVIPIVENYKDCLTLIQSDLYRRKGKKLTWLQILCHIIHPFSNNTLIWLRLSAYTKGVFYPICKFFYKLNSRKFLIDIPTKTKIGYGFYIGHGTNIIINPATIIGNNVNLSQFTNIGTNKQTPAMIGNQVYIAPMTCLVEAVKIGSNATIGAGAVVVHDIPKNATAVGVPAHVVHYNHPGRYITRKFEDNNPVTD